MHELGAEFHQRMRGVIGEDPSTNPIAGFQNHQIKPAGMKLVPSGETGCSGANDASDNRHGSLFDRNWPSSVRKFSANSKAQSGSHIRTSHMTAAQKAAAKKNIKKAAAVAKKKRTVAHLPKATRIALGKEGAKAAKKRRQARKK